MIFDLHIGIDYSGRETPASRPSGSSPKPLAKCSQMATKRNNSCRVSSISERDWKRRDGCHVWKPENFPEDDPRHGWTWDHCWQDAVALLGSEDAVRESIEGNPNKPEEEPDNSGSRDLFGDPIPQKPKQRKLF